MATKLVRKAGQKSLKSQGASYSTTNRKGETTYYKSAKDAPGYSDTTQSRSDMSKGGTPITKLDAGGKVITSEILAPRPQVPLATAAPIDSLYGRTNAANAALATMAGGTYDTKTNQMTTAASTQPADNSQAILGAFQTANASLEAPSAVDNFKEMDKMIRPKQRIVDSLSAQINTITQNRDAEMLNLEGQGRGVTESIIGGQQAQISREAAILAMPLQTQLAIAQDDLESARTYAGQYFQAKMQDDTNKYNQAKENNRLVFEFLNAQEQRRITQNDKALDREYAEKQSIDKTAENITMQAIEYGQSSLAQRVMNLDRKSPTYADDVRNAMAQLRKPVAAAASTKAPDLQNFGSTEAPDWRQYNPTTGAWDEVSGVGGGSNGSLNKAQKAKISDSIVANQELDGLIKEYKTLLDDVGFEGSTFGGENLGTFKALKARMTTTLKKAETLGTLDAGVIQLINDLVGELPEKGVAGQNWFGFQSRGISSQLKKQSELINAKITADQQRLSGVTFDMSQFDETDDFSVLDDIFGASNTTQSGAFSPDDWLN